jgi:hypothetical protein
MAQHLWQPCRAQKPIPCMRDALAQLSHEQSLDGEPRGCNTAWPLSRSPLPANMPKLRSQSATGAENGASAPPNVPRTTRAGSRTRAPQAAPAGPAPRKAVRQKHSAKSSSVAEEDSSADDDYKPSSSGSDGEDEPLADEAASSEDDFVVPAGNQQRGCHPDGQTHRRASGAAKPHFWRASVSNGCAYNGSLPLAVV